MDFSQFNNLNVADEIVFGKNLVDGDMNSPDLKLNAKQAASSLYVCRFYCAVFGMQTKSETRDRIINPIETNISCRFYAGLIVLLYCFSS